VSSATTCGDDDDRITVRENSVWYLEAVAKKA
jgi:hypothetical protein